MPVRRRLVRSAKRKSYRRRKPRSYRRRKPRSYRRRTQRRIKIGGAADKLIIQNGDRGNLDYQGEFNNQIKNIINRDYDGITLTPQLLSVADKLYESIESNSEAPDFIKYIHKRVINKESIDEVNKILLKKPIGTYFITKKPYQSASQGHPVDYIIKIKKGRNQVIEVGFQINAKQTEISFAPSGGGDIDMSVANSSVHKANNANNANYYGSAAHISQMANRYSSNTQLSLAAGVEAQKRRGNKDPANRTTVLDHRKIPHTTGHSPRNDRAKGGPYNMETAQGQWNSPSGFKRARDYEQAGQDEMDARLGRLADTAATATADSNQQYASTNF